MDLPELDKRIQAFRQSYCRPEHQGSPPLGFIAEMCFALGAKPTIVFARRPRPMIAEDIGLDAGGNDG